MAFITARHLAREPHAETFDQSNLTQRVIEAAEGGQVFRVDNLSESPSEAEARFAACEKADPVATLGKE